MKLTRLQDIDIRGKRVLVRVDYNVPFKNGEVGDTTRITETLPTLKHMIQAEAKIVLMSHLGRPKGKPVEEFSLRPVAKKLGELIGTKVHFASDCLGEAADSVISALKPGEIALLENLRFHPGEEANDDAFSAQLAKHGDIFIQDAFGTLHRAHSSTTGIPKHLKGGGIGFLVQKELEFLDRSIGNPVRPFVAILGGAKVSDKLKVIRRLLDRVDTLLIGGAMSYTFLQTQGISIGKSLLETERLKDAEEIIAAAFSKNVELLMPADHLMAAEISDDAKTQPSQGMAINTEMLGADIGPRTIELFTEKILEARTIFWNGPMGVFEKKPFAAGSLAIAEALAEATEAGATTIVGGGDSLAVMSAAGLKGKVTHCSTGGGASLKFLEGAVLPGLQALAEAA
ncbi:MAG: phosphoglycerate kinase [Elusimicrobiota bacterium]